MKYYRPEYDLKVIGRNLKRLRMTKGLSVEEVREYLRLGTPQAVYKYESGKGYPPADTMFALMELYGADMYDIIDEYVGTAEVEIKEGSEAGDFKLETVTFMKVCRRDRLKYMKKYAEMLEKYYKAG